MSNTADLINLTRDVLETIGSLSLPIYRYFHPVNTEGTERFVINSIPNNQVNSGPLKQNNDIVNVNFFVPKVSSEVDSTRIEVIDGLVQTAFENYNADSTRVGYYYLKIFPCTVFNENDKENLINIRVEATYT